MTDTRHDLAECVERPRYFTPTGDHREQPVPCRKCSRPTSALDRYCDPCAAVAAVSCPHRDGSVTSTRAIHPADPTRLFAIRTCDGCGLRMGHSLPRHLGGDER